MHYTWSTDVSCKGRRREHECKRHRHAELPKVFHVVLLKGKLWSLVTPSTVAVLRGGSESHILAFMMLDRYRDPSGLANLFARKEAFR